jgi:hypothetical protein
MVIIVEKSRHDEILARMNKFFYWITPSRVIPLQRTCAQCGKLVTCPKRILKIIGHFSSTVVLH